MSQACQSSASGTDVLVNVAPRTTIHPLSSSSEGLPFSDVLRVICSILLATVGDQVFRDVNTIDVGSEIGSSKVELQRVVVKQSQSIEAFCDLVMR